MAAFFQSRTPPSAAAFLRRPRGGHVVDGGAHRAGADPRGRGESAPPPRDEVNALEESRLGVA